MNQRIKLEREIEQASNKQPVKVDIKIGDEEARETQEQERQGEKRGQNRGQGLAPAKDEKDTRDIDKARGCEPRATHTNHKEKQREPEIRVHETPKNKKRRDGDHGEGDGSKRNECKLTGSGILDFDSVVSPIPSSVSIRDKPLSYEHMQILVDEQKLVQNCTQYSKSKNTQPDDDADTPANHLLHSFLNPQRGHLHQRARSKSSSL